MVVMVVVVVAVIVMPVIAGVGLGVLDVGATLNLQ
jgi:hypothetical protein